MICSFSKYSFLLLCSFLAMTFAGNQLGHCQDQQEPIFFIGAGDGTSWDDPLNWMPAGIPTIGNAVCIESFGTPYIVNVTSPSQCESLYMTAAAVLNVDAPLSVGFTPPGDWLGSPDFQVDSLATVNVNSDLSIDPNGIAFSAIFGGIVNLNSGTLATPCLSIGSNHADNSVINQNGGFINVSDRVMIQGTASLIIGPGDIVTGAEVSVAGAESSILVTVPLIVDFILVQSSTFTFEQPAGETTGISAVGVNISETLGSSAMHLEFDDAKDAGLRWALRLPGDQQVTLQNFLDNDLITTGGGAQPAEVIHDPSLYGDFTYIGFVVSDGILLGDVNCDGVVNLLDVKPFISLISSGGYSVKADFDEDGAVNLLDVAPFIAALAG